MNVDKFFSLFMDELGGNPNLYPYYKLNVGSDTRQKFRKAYFLQRLEYIDKNIDKSRQNKIFDCGCGYGTTALYLAMNNIAVYGNTLEFYYKEIENRKKYWKQFGNSDLFNCVYENIFDNPPAKESLDYIILQDTLHHIEPMNKALSMFYDALKKNGKLILVEVNANSIVESFVFFLKRGNKKIIEYYDEKIQKTILMGNENFRSEKQWETLFANVGFKVIDSETEYIRFFLPYKYKKNDVETVIKKERKIRDKSSILKKYGFWGLNMVFEK
ncbi:MAG TPA: class I SAM-dependent methyltransferase [Salinivirgaceae bacterium]|nr:class I SAM-dependent methyltransferase [Salinivirgaceae bacterium]